MRQVNGQFLLGNFSTNSLEFVLWNVTYSGHSTCKIWWITYLLLVFLTLSELRIAQKGKLCPPVCLHFNNVLSWYLSYIRRVTGPWIRAVMWVMFKGHNTFLLNRTAPVGCWEAVARVSGDVLKVIKTQFAEKRKIKLIFNKVCRWFQFISSLCHKQYSLAVITGPSDVNLFDVLIGQQKKHVLPSPKNES